MATNNNQGTGKNQSNYTNSNDKKGLGAKKGIGKTDNISGSAAVADNVGGNNAGLQQGNNMGKVSGSAWGNSINTNTGGRMGTTDNAANKPLGSTLTGQVDVPSGDDIQQQPENFRGGKLNKSGAEDVENNAGDTDIE